MLLRQRCNNGNDLYASGDFFQTLGRSCRPFFGGSTPLGGGDETAFEPRVWGSLRELTTPA